MALAGSVPSKIPPLRHQRPAEKTQLSAAAGPVLRDLSRYSDAHRYAIILAFREGSTGVSQQPELSIIVAFRDEEDSIAPLHAAIVAGVEPLGVPFEMVFVNDGSQDRTLEIATSHAQADERITVINFRRNYGQTQAMAAGIAQATGRVLVTMDGDLQNDPRDVGSLLAKINEGYDIVVGWRHERHDRFWSRRLPSRAANWLIARVTGVPVRDVACSLKAYRAAVIKAIPLYSDMHRFIPAMASLAGARITELKVRHHPRQFGRSKYGLSRTYKVLIDLLVIRMITAFSARPLLWFTRLAAPLFLIGVSMLVHSLWNWSADNAVFPLPVAGSGLVFLLASLLLVMQGALGELAYRFGDVRQVQFSRLTKRVWDQTDSGTSVLKRNPS
jgi:glycosyltransferase involved in cell wall biosynthesis